MLLAHVAVRAPPFLSPPARTVIANLRPALVAKLLSAKVSCAGGSSVILHVPTAELLSGGAVGSVKRGSSRAMSVD